MDTYIRAFIFALVASVIPIAYSLTGIESLDGWGAIAKGLATIYIIIAISLCFGIAGFILNKEKRFLSALSWLVISLGVMLLLNFAFAPYRQAIWDRSHPQTQNHSPCEPNYVGESTCEEWQKTYQPPQRKTP